MKKLNPLRLLLLISVIIFVCLNLYRSLNSSPGNGRSMLGIDQSKVDKPKLIEVLRKVTMADRTVIVTVVDEAWARPGSVLELFLRSFQVGIGTKKFLNHTLIVTTDHEAYQYCNDKHFHCFPLPTRKPLMYPHRSRFDLKIIGLLKEVSHLGYNVLFTDADVMWLNNPFQHIDPLLEMTIASEVFTGDPKSSSNKADTGFFFVKSNEIALEFLKYWELSTAIYPGRDAQSQLELIKEDDVVKVRLGPRIKYLDTALYGGFCQPNKDMSQIHTMHANCCEDLESKIHDLRFVLDDWRRSMIGPSTQNSSWSVPNKCRKRIGMF